jgi:hypothetical protein
MHQPPADAVRLILERSGQLPECVVRHYPRRMPKPPTPPDLKRCPDCGKVIGPHKGWFGPEYYCGREPKPGDALRGAQEREPADRTNLHHKGTELRSR